MNLFRASLFLAVMECAFVFLLKSQEAEFHHPEAEWYTIETAHFLIHYHAGEERSAQLAAKIAEDVYLPITELYHHEPDQKVSIVIRDFDDYSNGGAYFYDNKIEIFAPALDYDLRGTHDWLRNVISHEFTHIVQIQCSMKFGRRVPGIYLQWLGYESERRTDVLYGYPNILVSYPVSGFVVPAWFAEGTAQYNRPELGYESWDSHRDMILRMEVLEHKLLTWDEMGVFGKTSLGNEEVYNAGYALSNYIAWRFGEEKLRELSRRLASVGTWTIDQAMKDVLGISGRDLYREWKAYLDSTYSRRTAAVRAYLVDGEKLAGDGFANLHPVFSPDGSKLAYLSNKRADYFGLTAIYVLDLSTSKEERLAPGARKSFSWSPDGKKIYFARVSRDNRHWSNVFDLYVVDVASGKERRLTYGLRAFSPSVSPDGTALLFVTGRDGTLNIARCDSSGRNVTMLTNFANGEQVYSPHWSPDGKQIVFAYSDRVDRHIALLNADGSGFRLFPLNRDARDPVFSSDGKWIYFAWDTTGIFNIYRMSVDGENIEQLTNVLGSAFMPTVSFSGALAYSSYGADGFSIRWIAKPHSIQLRFHYVNEPLYPVHQLASNSSQSMLGDNHNSIDWIRLQRYDDRIVPSLPSYRYRNVFSSLTLVPFVRVDNYNPRNKGIDVIKPGAYFFSNDVLGNVGIFGGVAVNRKLERDLFLIFSYGDRLPGLWKLGIEPTLSFEVYNITRATTGFIGLETSTIPVDVTYNLLEFDLAAQQPICSEKNILSLRYSHSRYSADIGTFILPISRVLVPASRDQYFIGNSIKISLAHMDILPSRDEEINPIGRKLAVRYTYEFSKLSSGEYEASSAGLVPKYDLYRFHRAEILWNEYLPLPISHHVLTVGLRAGTIFGPPVSDFFDFYAGGMIGMRGYPFYGLSGNRIGVVSVSYRFPLFRHIDRQIGFVYIDKLYGSVFGDLGNAWTGVWSPPLAEWKRDAGAELRLETYSFYSYPTRIFVSAAYGFDRYTRAIKGGNFTYGREWRFYVGVLFGFEFEP
ncbi:MAG: biopolymer transporter Tol [Bacteroidota bacterium]